MATVMGASGNGFLAASRLAATSLLGALVRGALGSAPPGPQDLVATVLKIQKFRNRAKTLVLWLEKWGTSLWKR